MTYSQDAILPTSKGPHATNYIQAKMFHGQRFSVKVSCGNHPLYNRNLYFYIASFKLKYPQIFKRANLFFFSSFSSFYKPPTHTKGANNYTLVLILVVPIETKMSFNLHIVYISTLRAASFFFFATGKMVMYSSHAHYSWEKQEIQPSLSLPSKLYHYNTNVPMLVVQHQLCPRKRTIVYKHTYIVFIRGIGTSIPSIVKQ